jgi:hypothetical protein
MHSMFVQMPMPSGPTGVMLVEESVPYVAALIADGEKYYVEPKRLEGSELRRHAARGPILRSLVRLAVASDSAEETGKKWKRRFDRSLQRRG